MIPKIHEKKLLSDMIRLFLPLECPVCGGVPFDGSPNMFCRDCLKQMEFLVPPFCSRCGGEYEGFLDVCPECLEGAGYKWDGAFCAFAMRGFLKEQLHCCKYQNQPELAEALGGLGFMAVRDRLPAVDAVVPVPLHWKRYLNRGFNQAELLAKCLARHLNVPCFDVLGRRKSTKQQAKLAKSDRQRNLSRAFFIKNSTNVRKRAILLVDDVMTTGSTLSAAASVLKRAGASKVYVFALAKRLRN